MGLANLYEIRNDVYRRPLVTAVQRIGLGPGWKVADIGAGNGDVSVALATQVGGTGRVYAVDIDPRRRDEIANKASLFTQVVSVTQAVEDLALPEKIDLSFSRFLLLGVQDPKLALAKIIASVRTGGWVIMQEPITSAGRVGHNPISSSAPEINWPDIGVELPRLITESGVAILDMWAESPVGYRDGPVLQYLSHMTDSEIEDQEVIILPPIVTVIAQVI